MSVKKDSYKWVVLVIAFMLMLTFAISLQSLPQIFNEIQKDIAFSNSQAGILMGAYAIPGILLPFLVAFLANRYNKKSIIIISLIIMMLGLIGFSKSTSFSTLLTFRLVTGIGATALVILAPLLVTMFFDKKNIGIGMGIFNTAVPTGTVIATNLFGILGQRIPWRSIILAIALFIGIVLVINIFSLYLPKEEARNSKKISKDLQKDPSASLLSNVNLWIIALVWMLGNGQLLSYVTFVPQFYQETGMNMQRAGLLTSFIMFVPIFLSPLVGIVMDKTGWKKRLILIGTIISAISYLMISRGGSFLPLWAIALGVGFSPMPVFIFTHLPEIVKPHQMGMGLGVLTMSSNLGIAIGPASLGFLLDKTGGNFNLGFIFLSLVSLIIIFILGRLNKKEKLKLSSC